ncbi:MAG: geranylgeranyl reductase family protein [Acidimicrobiia bacterium]
MNPDVLIVGAGPAGAASAIAIKRAAPQAQVVLADRAEFPRDKTCGDGIGPGVVAVLNELGLPGLLSDHEPIDEVVVYGPHGASVAGPLPEIDGRRITGFVSPREVFDARLVQAASDAGVQVVSGWRATTTELQDNERAVEFATPTGAVTVAAPLVVGADGASSVVRRSLGIEAPGARATGIAVRAYAPFRLPADSPLRRSLLFEFSERYLPAYAWWFPGPNDVANVGLGLPVHDLRKRRLDLRVAVKEFVADLRSRGIDIDDPDRVRTYTLPTGASLRKLAHPHSVLVGDAAAMINPLSGEGIFYGMAAGAMLGAAYGGDGSLDDRLRTFERAFRRRFRSHYLHNFVAQQMLRSPRWARKGVAAAAADPRVLQDAVALMFGDGRITVRTGLRIAATRPTRTPTV